jgi:hypothetical protein
MRAYNNTCAGSAVIYEFTTWRILHVPQWQYEPEFSGGKG